MRWSIDVMMRLASDVDDVLIRLHLKPPRISQIHRHGNGHERSSGSRKKQEMLLEGGVSRSLDVLLDVRCYVN